MKYDPVKRSLGKIFNKFLFTRILFYKLLDLLLLRSWHIKKEIRQIKNKLGKRAAILDAGAGFGQYTYFLTHLAPDWEITAVDINEEQVDDCNMFFMKIGKSGQVHFEVSDLTKFKQHEKFNLALSVDVMEHIEDDVSVFKNILEALKPGGIFLLSTPSDKGGSDVHHDHDESFIDEHVRDGYSIEEIENKLKSTGFSETISKYSYGIPGKISWKLSMKYPILLINISNLFFILLPFYYLITFPICLVLNLLDVNNFHKTGSGLIVKAIK